MGAIGWWYCFAFSQPFGPVQRQSGSFEMRVGVDYLPDQRVLAHLSNQIGRELRRLKKSPRSFDVGNRLGHAVGEGECGLDVHRFVTSSAGAGFSPRLPQKQQWSLQGSRHRKIPLVDAPWR